MISRWIDILAVGGTWYRKRRKQAPQWCDANHPLSCFLYARGFRWLVGRDGRRFDWSSRLIGWQFWRRWTRLFADEPDRSDWENDGIHLHNTVDPPFGEGPSIEGKNLHIIAHSHGGNVVFFACANGMKVNVLVLVCTPVRADMLDVIRRARPNIGRIIMIYSDASDVMQILGEIGDGYKGPRRKFDHDGPCPDAGHDHIVDEYVFVDDGHSNILNDATRFNRLEPILKCIQERHGRPDYLAAR